jgi:RND family efflux transporter MFP subunit
MESNEVFHTPVTEPPRAPRSKTGVRVAMAVGLLAFVGLGVFTGVRVNQALAKQKQVAVERTEAQASATKKPPAAATKPKRATYKAHVEVTGTLKPWREADVGFETSGRLIKIYVGTGDAVKANQSLALLDGTRAGEMVQIKEASLRAAQAQTALAEDNAKRSEALAASKSIPEAQVEQSRQQAALARANLEAAKADLQMARTGAGLHTITSPFAGIVTRAPTAAGGVVAPGTPLVRVEDLSKFRLSATVAEEDAPLVHVGQAAVLRYRDRSVSGKVIAVVPSLDQGTRRAPVEVEIPNDPKVPLLAWSFVRASIEGEGEQAVLALPSTARRPGSQDEVVVVSGGKAKVVRVTHAVASDGTWYVRSGLNEDDVVLVAPPGDLKDGDAIAELSVQ